MNVLHINQSDVVGGAAIAAYRLHLGLRTKGISSRLLVGSVENSSDFVAGIPGRYYVDRMLYRISDALGLNYTNVLSSFGLVSHPFYRDATVLHVHNLHTGYFNYLALPKLARGKRVIYTLHDMWSFTGHCSYSFSCDRWKSGCGHCPYPDTYPAVRRDNTALEFRLKSWCYGKVKPIVVAPSRWLADLARQSMLKRFPIHHIPYGIDTRLYQPLGRELCRSSLGIASTKFVLMLSTVKLREQRKGADLLLRALARLPESLRAETLLLTLGRGGEAISAQAGLDALDLGYIGSDRVKVIAYSAADLLVLPTRADNLPVVLLESMACGTPMVSFDVGGVAELVRPGITGYLAPPSDVDALCTGIMQLRENKHLRDRMSQNCREIAEKEYPIGLQTSRYVDLYQGGLA